MSSPADGAGLNLDLPYIDYPTAWAIQRAGGINHQAACSAQQTGGAMLCDCNGLVYKWADLKWKHERAKSAAEIAGRLHELADALLAAGCHHGHQQGETDECNACTAFSLLRAMDGRGA